MPNIVKNACSFHGEQFGTPAQERNTSFAIYVGLFLHARRP
jgi:hypothetical protein